MSGPDKAYKNLPFLNSPAARHIRLLCEYEEPRQRFQTEKVRDTIVFFGSARIRTQAEAQATLDHARRQLAAARGDEEQRRLQHQVVQCERRAHLARYYDDARLLGEKLTRWSMESKDRAYYVCTGGGPGIMEAGNRGAADVPGGRSVGLGISLPFEEKLNPWVTPDLGFEFHYFFMRKYWFMYLAKALVLFPGGFGTMDEMFESFTLRQTGKIKKPIPTVLYGADYWNAVVDIQAMVSFGTISEADLLLFHRSDSVDDTFNFLVNSLEENERIARANDEHPPHVR
jgi:uncharacterized protein (TIGR00730 family)